MKSLRLQHAICSKPTSLSCNQDNMKTWTPRIVPIRYSKKKRHCYDQIQTTNIIEYNTVRASYALKPDFTANGGALAAETLERRRSDSINLANGVLFYPIKDRIEQPKQRRFTSVLGSVICAGLRCIRPNCVNAPASDGDTNFILPASEIIAQEFITKRPHRTRVNIYNIAA